MELHHRRCLIGVSLKMYMGLEQTRLWMTDLARTLEPGMPPNVVLFVIPSFLSLQDARTALAGTGVALGAQDVFWEDHGAFTGEISAPMLVEAGCRFVEIGHAERRRIFHETDDIVARKVSAAVRAGLTPILCIGEETPMTPDEAAEECVRQFLAAVDGVDPGHPLVLAYEPVWAIGAARPSPPAYIMAVADRLRRALGERSGMTLIYGGSAGPGLLTTLGSSVDGLFLGRFAHRITDLQAIIQEAALKFSP